MIAPTVKSLEPYLIKKHLKEIGEKDAIDLIKSLERIIEGYKDLQAKSIASIRDLSAALKNATNKSL